MTDSFIISKYGALPKHRAIYTIKNLIFNAKQFYYTYSGQTEFLKREENTDGK